MLNSTIVSYRIVSLQQRNKRPSYRRGTGRQQHIIWIACICRRTNAPFWNKFQSQRFRPVLPLPRSTQLYVNSCLSPLYSEWLLTGLVNTSLLSTSTALITDTWPVHNIHSITSTDSVNDWIVQCLTSPPTQYRLYGRQFLQCERTITKFSLVSYESAYICNFLLLINSNYRRYLLPFSRYWRI